MENGVTATYGVMLPRGADATVKKKKQKDGGQSLSQLSLYDL